MGELHQREPVELDERKAFTTTFERDVLRRFVVCARCGERMRRRSDYQLDHEIPLQIGGKHDPSNVQPLCVDCHKKKTALDQAIIAKAKRLAGETCAGPTKRPIAQRPGGGWPAKGTRKLPTAPFRRFRPLPRVERSL